MLQTSQRRFKAFQTKVSFQEQPIVDENHSRSEWKKRSDKINSIIKQRLVYRASHSEGAKTQSKVL